MQIAFSLAEANYFSRMLEEVKNVTGLEIRARFKHAHIEVVMYSDMDESQTPYQASEITISITDF